MARIEYSNGAHLTIARQKVMLHTVRYIEQPGGASPEVVSTVSEQQFNELAKDAQALGGRYNAQRFIFPIEQLDAVKEIASSMWGELAQPEPTIEDTSDPEPTSPANPAPASTTAAPSQPELEIHESSTHTESGLWPWQTGEAHNWFKFELHHEEGVGVGHARRTASAHEIGRMLLRKYPHCTRVEVGEEYLPLAFVTDPAPVCATIQRVERDVEIGRRARAELDGALRRLKVSVPSAWGEDDNEEHPGHSGNQLAALVNGVASRPTVLKWLQIDADEAHLA